MHAPKCSRQETWNTYRGRDAGDMLVMFLYRDLAYIQIKSSGCDCHTLTRKSLKQGKFKAGLFSGV